MGVFWFVIIYSLFVTPQQAEVDVWEEGADDHNLDEWEDFNQWPF